MTDEEILALVAEVVAWDYADLIVDTEDGEGFLKDLQRLEDAYTEVY